MAIAGFAQTQAQDCNMQITFDNPEVNKKWRIVNDGVMGGLSSGGPRFENDRMIFEGVINTNGGGFSSVRLDVQQGLLRQASGVSLRVKSDGRAYKVSFRTNARYRGRPVSFQAQIPNTPRGEWADVNVSFEDLRASLFGRPISGAVFEASEIWELGIILADGQDGPFRLEVDTLSDCRVTKP